MTKKETNISESDDSAEIIDYLFEEEKRNNGDSKTRQDEQKDQDKSQIDGDNSFVETMGNTSDSDLDSELPLHKKKKTKKPTKGIKSNFPFKCEICGQGFMYIERYHGHLREHEGKRVMLHKIINNPIKY